MRCSQEAYFASGVRAELEAFKDRRYTGIRGPFRRLRDWVLSINSLPEKVLKDCANCPKNTCCDEIAMTYETGASPKPAELPRAVTDGQR